VGTVVAQTPPAGGSASKGAAVAIMVSKGAESLQVPSVVGKAKEDAVSALEAAGFVIAVDEETDEAAKGTVIAQAPSGAATVGSAVNITVSKGPDLVKVPDISGLIDPDPLLKKAGLKGKGIAVHGPIESDAAGIGEAYRQDPAAGTLVPKGTTVTYHFWWESQ
jgi:serine/threonine-protein kinase